MARARLSPLDLNKYSLIEGGLIELEGARKSAFRLVYDSTIEEGCVGLDPVGMKNVGRDTGGEVRFYKVGNSYAERILKSFGSGYAEKALALAKGYQRGEGDV